MIRMGRSLHGELQLRPRILARRLGVGSRSGRARAPRAPRRDAGPAVRRGGAGIPDYARLVPPADVVVGHSLGGLIIPLVDARKRVYLCALVPGVDRDDAYVPGF